MVAPIINRCLQDSNRIQFTGNSPRRDCPCWADYPNIGQSCSDLLTLTPKQALAASLRHHLAFHATKYMVLETRICDRFSQGNSTNYARFPPKTARNRPTANQESSLFNRALLPGKCGFTKFLVGLLSPAAINVTLKLTGRAETKLNSDRLNGLERGKDDHAEPS
jgi:hypothetical protein